LKISERPEEFGTARVSLRTSAVGINGRSTADAGTAGGNVGTSSLGWDTTTAVWILFPVSTEGTVSVLKVADTAGGKSLRLSEEGFDRSVAGLKRSSVATSWIIAEVICLTCLLKPDVATGLC
jgi:hypothetical protein